jgi:hypothetical protein
MYVVEAIMAVAMLDQEEEHLTEDLAKTTTLEVVDRAIAKQTVKGANRIMI